jgi:hypothetical protein
VAPVPDNKYCRSQHADAGTARGPGIRSAGDAAGAKLGGCGAPSLAASGGSLAAAAGTRHLELRARTIKFVAEFLEWWPDYGAGPLWRASGRGGEPLDIAELDLPADLVVRLAAWNRDYNDDKLPMAGGGDRDWLARGTGLLTEVRQCLEGRFAVTVTEPWWEEAPRS